MNNADDKKAFTPAIVIIALLNVGLHMAVAGNLEYHRDELLYFSLGQHPAAGYATVPPMIGWIAWIVQNIFGYSVYAVRLLPAVMSGVMIILVAGMAREFGGSKYSEILSSVGFTISGFGLRTFSMYMPVFLDVVFWTLILFLLLKYINSRNDRYLIYLGIAAGAALLNKYLIGVLYFGIIVIVPFTEFRIVLRKKMFWYGIIAAFVVFLPNMVWQIVNRLPVINHMAELNRTQLVNVDRITFLKEQIMNPGLASILTIAGIIFLLIDKKASRYKFLGILMLFIVLSLMLMRGKSYYTQGIYPFLIAAGAVSYDFSIRRKLWRIFLPAIMVVLAIPILPMGLPVLKSESMVKYFSRLEKKYGIVIGRTFEDNTVHSLPQDYADMIGWEQLTRVTDSAYNMIYDKSSALIYAENYGQAGAITVIGIKYGLPQVVCFNESFRYWIPHDFNTEIKSLIYINGELGDDVASLFRNIQLVGKITDRNAREFGTSVYLCQDPKASFNALWKKRISELDN